MHLAQALQKCPRITIARGHNPSPPLVPTPRLWANLSAHRPQEPNNTTQVNCKVKMTHWQVDRTPPPSWKGSWKHTAQNTTEGGRAGQRRGRSSGGRPSPACALSFLGSSPAPQAASSRGPVPQGPAPRDPAQGCGAGTAPAALHPPPTCPPPRPLSSARGRFQRWARS